MSSDAAQQIVDLAFAANPAEPGFYLLGIAIGLLQNQGRGLTAIQDGVEIAFGTSSADARALAESIDRAKGGPS